MFKTLGPLGALTVITGAIGVTLAVVTLVLVAGRKPASRVTGLLCLLAAGAALALAALGHSLAMISVTSAVGNVPFDVKAELLLRGTLEARELLFVGLLAAALPWLVGSMSMLVTRSPVGGGVAVLVAAGLAWSVMGYAQPLPSGKTMLAPVEGLRLPSSTAGRHPGAQPLLSLTPDGLWLEDVKVPSVAFALEDARVLAQNPDALPLAVDGRVPFSALVDVLEAAGGLKRHDFDLVVHSASGDLSVIRVRDAEELVIDPYATPPLRLTLRVTGKEAQFAARAGALDPLPLDWRAVGQRAQEIKASFPGETNLRVTADAEVSMDVLVKALDATREAENHQLLFPDVVLGRFDAKDADPGSGARRADLADMEMHLPRPSDEGVDREKLAAYVGARKAAIQGCYERELRRHPGLKGKIVTRFSITPWGRTEEIEIEENTLGTEAVANCLKLLIRGWVFPFRPSASVAIAYPFVFSPAQ